jgi:hypothetical protein
MIEPPTSLPTDTEIAALIEECALEDPEIFHQLDAMLAGDLTPIRKPTCEACGSEIALGRRSDARTCGPTCRWRLWRDRAASATAGSDI